MRAFRSVQASPLRVVQKPVRRLARWEAGGGLLPGTPVGRYVIGEPLASSPSSQLFEVYHCLIGAKAILKVCSYDDGAAEREARALAQLDGVGVPAVLEIGRLPSQLGGASYFVMEFVAGKRLSQLLRERRRFEPQTAVRLVLQLLEALNRAHHLGIVHGDIKPDNVLVRSGRGLSERAVLIDFGIGSVGASPISGRQQLATHQYAAPEVLRGHAPSLASDVFGVGLLLYEMLLGEPPQWMEADGELRCRELSLLIPVSEALSQAVQTALADGAEQRYGDCAQFVRVLRDLDGSDIEGYGGEGSIEGGLCREQAHTVQVSSPEESRPSLVAPNFRGQTSLCSTETPSVWLVAGDPATDDPNLINVLEAMGDRYRVRILLDDEKEDARQEYLRGGSPPWVLVFGELHAWTGEPVVTDAGRHGETVRLALSKHPEARRLSRTINACGLHAQLCLPASGTRVREVIERAIAYSRGMRRRYDGLRVDAADLQRDWERLKQEVGRE